MYFDLNKTLNQGLALVENNLIDETDLEWFITTIAKNKSSKWEDFFNPPLKSDLEHLIKIWSLPKLTQVVNQFSNPCLFNSFYDLFFFYPKPQTLNPQTNPFSVNRQFLSFVKLTLKTN